jgi:hypothetical protein
MDMWTTQERCPHAHSLNNKYKRLNQPRTKSPTDSPEEAKKGGGDRAHVSERGRHRSEDLELRLNFYVLGIQGYVRGVE